MDLEALRIDLILKFLKAKKGAKSVTDIKKAYYDYVDARDKIMNDWFTFNPKEKE